MTASSPRPPRLAERLLAWMLPIDETSAILRGDLLEEFCRRGDTAEARRWYWREALVAIGRLGWRRPARRRATGLFEGSVRDGRFAIRAYLRTPWFTAAVVGTIALAIGAASAIFAMADGILIRPLPFPNPDRLIWMNEVTAAGDVTSVSWPDYLDWQARARSFDRLAASRADQFTLTGAGQATRLSGRRVTSDFFAVLGVNPAGRAFAPADDRAGATPVAIVTDELVRQLGDDRAGLGRTLQLDGRAFTVVGILPRGFKYLRPYDVFVANGAFMSNPAMNERFNHFGYIVVGRLRTGANLEGASTEMRLIESDISREHPEAGTVHVTLAPLGARLVNDVRQTLLVLCGAVGMLLLIAVANVANLLAARGAARRHELALRAALGAGRARLVRQFLIESVLVSLVGAAAGLAVAVVMLRALVALAPAGTPRLDEYGWMAM